jgi:hypothetical protein
MAQELVCIGSSSAHAFGLVVHGYRIECIEVSRGLKCGRGCGNKQKSTLGGRCGKKRQTVGLKASACGRLHRPLEIDGPESSVQVGSRRAKRKMRQRGNGQTWTLSPPHALGGSCPASCSATQRLASAFHAAKAREAKSPNKGIRD